MLLAQLGSHLLGQAGALSAVIILKLSMMDTVDKQNNHKYVHELVWLPTYIAICLLVIGSTFGHWIGFILMPLILIVCRMILELLYRLVFGIDRLGPLVGVIAFASQTCVWTMLFIFLND